jgi:hypothetical protein
VAAGGRRGEGGRDGGRGYEGGELRDGAASARAGAALGPAGGRVARVASLAAGHGRGRLGLRRAPGVRAAARICSVPRGGVGRAVCCLGSVAVTAHFDGRGGVGHMRNCGWQMLCAVGRDRMTAGSWRTALKLPRPR